MSTHAQGTFQVSSWDEEPYADIDEARKLSRARVTQRFAGDLEGEGQVEWLMCYRADGTADWVGLQRVVGRLAGREGSFVLRSSGTFDGRTAAGDWHVVDGSGTGELAQLAGQGRMEAPMGATPSFTLDYDLQ